eukprot:Pgem_evm1s8503
MSDSGGCLKAMASTRPTRPEDLPIPIRPVRLSEFPKPDTDLTTLVSATLYQSKSTLPTSTSSPKEFFLKVRKKDVQI